MSGALGREGVGYDDVAFPRDMNDTASKPATDQLFESALAELIKIL
jgi:hypothetical protein